MEGWQAAKYDRLSPGKLWNPLANPGMVYPRLVGAWGVWECSLSVG